MKRLAVVVILVLLSVVQDAKGFYGGPFDAEKLLKGMFFLFLSITLRKGFSKGGATPLNNITLRRLMVGD